MSDRVQGCVQVLMPQPTLCDRIWQVALGVEQGKHLPKGFVLKHSASELSASASSLICIGCVTKPHLTCDQAKS